MSIISRTATIDSHAGRHLEGVAYLYDTPALVTDDGRTKYLEAFSRSAATKSIADRNRFALAIGHPWTSGAGSFKPVPIGAVTFIDGDAGLMFDAVVSRTRDGDEALELVNDGGLHDVSVSARLIRSSKRSSPRGPVIYRDEIGLRELSLAPPGMGQHHGAEVLAVRSEIVPAGPVSGTPALDASRRRLMLLTL